MSQCLILAYATKQLDAESGKYEEEQKEQKTEISDFRQRLHDCVQQRADRLRHLQQLEHLTTASTQTADKP